MPTARPARTREDRLAVIAVAHAATKPESSLEHFQARRLAHPQRQTADWWLLEEGGRAVASCLCYPLRFGVAGRAVPGHGLGAVATRPEARRRGYASFLCRAAIEHAEAQGARIGLLYSAIPPPLYERLGYRVAPARHVACADLAALAESGAHERLAAVDPYREGAALARLWERAHGDALHMHRDEERFVRNLAFGPTELFFGVGESLEGYVRVNVDDDTLEVVEDVLPPERRAAAIRALARLAARLEKKGIEGWFDPDPETARHFVDKGRATTLPMVRGHEDLRGARFWSSDYF